MSYITTVGGIHFDPIEPKEELLDIRDIAHSLSLICRANGHTKQFYSVAQHSLCCAKEAMARGYQKEVVLGCLLHDGSEAYLSDVTRPVKKDLTYYLQVEERLQNLIFSHFIGRALSKNEQAQVFEIDDQMLSMEFLKLMPETLNELYRELVREVDCTLEDPQKVEDEFLSLYEELVQK